MVTIKTELGVKPGGRNREAVENEGDSVLDHGLRLLSSVRFGIVMLMLLLACCLIGMLVMQDNMEEFAGYYERMAPAQRLFFDTLGFFDIYHSWYFTALLAVTGLNIVLSSIDRFPVAWGYIRKPRVKASPNFIRAQSFNAVERLALAPEQAAAQISAAWRKNRLRSSVTVDGGRVTVFAQRNAWNRLGAYVVHVALLLILVGGFLTSRYGVGGVMEISPGNSSNVFMIYDTPLDGAGAARAQLPFEIECTDLQQQLIKPEAGLDVMNTIDWLSFIRIKDGDRIEEALVHLNRPYDYRGYRFFQSSFEPVGNARQITVSLEPVEGGAAREFTIARNGSVEVEGVGRVAFVGFYPDFHMRHGEPVTASAEYLNPVAELRITAGGERRAFAVSRPAVDQGQQIDEHSAAHGAEPSVVSGNRLLLKDFEKVAASHTLTVQYDPGRLPVYVGFLLLCVSLCAVFLFSHQRVWAVIEPGGSGSTAYFGGNTNRNKSAFEARFNSLVRQVTRRSVSDE